MNYAKTDDPKRARRFSTVEDAEIRLRNIGLGDEYATRIEADPDGHGCHIIKVWPKHQQHYMVGRFWIQDKKLKVACTAVVSEAAALAATDKRDV